VLDSPSERPPPDRFVAIDGAFDAFQLGPPGPSRVFKQASQPATRLDERPLPGAGIAIDGAAQSHC
jgi:hypothetical protein